MLNVTAVGLLERYHRAMINMSADDLADLYSEDAVHELPFAHNSAATLRGREAVRARYRVAWASAPVKVRAINNVIVHQTIDPDVIISEQDAVAINTATGAEFAFSFVLVVRTNGSHIAHVRDYTDNLTIANALGRPPAVS